MSWRLAACLIVLREQVNAAYPHRNTASDGTIGDARHQSQGSASDHNPNAYGVVTAWDITTDTFTDALAENLRRAGARGDARIKYVIYKRRITSAIHGWEWAAYDGEDPHTSHIHLSVSADPAEYDRTDGWVNVVPGALTPPAHITATALVTASAPVPPTIAEGFTGPWVALLQWCLNRQGIRPAINVDGAFGPLTTRALRAIQLRRGIQVDGVAGPQTWAVLL